MKRMNNRTEKNNSNYISLPLMTVSETAKYMGIGRKVVGILIDLGEIRVVKSQRTTLIEKASVDRYMHSGKRI